MKRKRLLPKGLLPKWFGKHPNPTRRERLALEIPGGVQRPTKRETVLRSQLRQGELPSLEEFDKTVQVFAQRARQEIRWLPVQRREFIRRAKRWASEMLLQDMMPSRLSLQLLLLACAATGDVSGARWWFQWAVKQGLKLGRLEYNALIGAHGAEGQPREAQTWLNRMREEGIVPDAKSYAGLVEAWDRIGNRERMLQTILEMKRAEAEGNLGEPTDPKDSALPYYVMARSYAKVADAPRALAILKTLQARGMPLSHEAHKVRLEAHLRVPSGPRRSVPEIERALIDLISNKPSDGPLYHSRLSGLCRSALGSQRYEEILRSLGTSDLELVPELPGTDASAVWRRASIQAALRTAATGKSAVQGKSDDERFFRKRLNARKQAQMGEIQVGYRVPGEKGLPEWMTLQKPEKFG